MIPCDIVPSPFDDKPAAMPTALVPGRDLAFVDLAFVDLPDRPDRTAEPIRACVESQAPGRVQSADS
jgi:hypothetical protein